MVIEQEPALFELYAMRLLNQQMQSPTGAYIQVYIPVGSTFSTRDLASTHGKLWLVTQRRTAGC